MRFESHDNLLSPSRSVSTKNTALLNVFSNGELKISPMKISLIFKLLTVFHTDLVCHTDLVWQYVYILSILDKKLYLRYTFIIKGLVHLYKVRRKSFDYFKA